MQHNILATRIRNNLLEQRKRLEDYLLVLDKEHEDISIQDPDKLIEHINLEKNIINELVSFKKILGPLEIIYYGSPYKKDTDILNMKNKIDSLVDKVKVKSKENKEKLTSVMEKIKTDIKELKKKGLENKVYNNVDSKILDLIG
ncbi:MAG: hypothetical protein JXB50_06660 [Spirochaetes bacterium]|nr:hypothetical protein [Spirochaetota bacterium]